MKENERDLKFKELSDIIVKSLTSDPEVMSMLADLQGQDFIEHDTVLGMALKVGELLEQPQVTITEETLIKEKRARRRADDEKKSTQIAIREKMVIDGRNLTKNERAFQEWSAERFDETSWLKSTGLIW